MEINIVFSFDYIDIFLTSISLDKMKVYVLINNINLKKMGFFNLDKKVSESIQKKLRLSNYQMQWFVFIFGFICGILVVSIL